MKRPSWLLGVAAVAIVVFGVLLASSFPDGLGRVAADLGFASREAPVLDSSPLAGYETRFLPSSWAAQVSAGLVGLLLMYGFGVLLGRTLKRKR